MDEKYQNYRVSEALLRRRGIGLYNTSSEKKTSKEKQSKEKTSGKEKADWVQNGLRIYEGLRSGLGYSLWDSPGKVIPPAKGRTLIEVHPHACFVVGLGWIPPNKRSVSGQVARAAYIRHAGAARTPPLQGACWPREDLLEKLAKDLTTSTWAAILEDGLRFETLSHDVIDALGGLLTAMDFAAGTAYAVGEREEGVIVLPKKPNEVATPYRRKGSE